VDPPHALQISPLGFGSLVLLGLATKQALKGERIDKNKIHTDGHAYLELLLY
jgi:hypothetical protein